MVCEFDNLDWGISQARRAWFEPKNVLNTLPLAIECADRFGGAVVYDSHEMFTEAGSTSQLPALVRMVLRRLEREWSRRATAVITVNDSLARRDSCSRSVALVSDCQLRNPMATLTDDQAEAIALHRWAVIAEAANAFTLKDYSPFIRT